MSFDTVCSIEKNVHDIENGQCNWCGIPQAAVDHIATQAAAIEALESKLDYPHEEIAELEAERDGYKEALDASGKERERQYIELEQAKADRDALEAKADSVTATECVNKIRSLTPPAMRRSE